jgi:hypothetical protein
MQQITTLDTTTGWIDIQGSHFLPRVVSLGARSFFQQVLKAFLSIRNWKGFNQRSGRLCRIYNIGPSVTEHHRRVILARNQTGLAIYCLTFIYLIYGLVSEALLSYSEVIYRLLLRC